MSKTRVRLVILTLALCAAVQPAYGVIPGFRGYTALFFVPTADALMKGEWNAGLFCENVASGTLNSYVANYGIIDNLEVGFDRYRPDTETNSGTLLNMKYEFYRTCPERFGLAAGIVDLTNDLETSVYLVGSASLISRPPVWHGEVLAPRVHVGFGGGMLNSLFGGFSTWLGNRVQIIAEWDSSAVSSGAKFRITPDITLHAGGMNLAAHSIPGTSLDNTAAFGLGINYNYSY